MEWNVCLLWMGDNNPMSVGVERQIIISSDNISLWKIYWRTRTEYLTGDLFGVRPHKNKRNSVYLKLCPALTDYVSTKG